MLKFQSTPPARGATASMVLRLPTISISIHAPREGGDWIFHPTDTVQTPISIHAPREGGDVDDILRLAYVEVFQSTPPARGATPSCRPSAKVLQFQSTPPARGATAPPRRRRRSQAYFNPRPPRGGRLPVALVALVIHQTFQSTPPARGATDSSSFCTRLRAFQSTPPARGATAKMHSFTCGSLTNK